MDDLTVQDCQFNGIFTSLAAEIGLLHVTNSNVFRCASSGMFLNARGNIILENIFVKGNRGDGISNIFNAGAVALKNTKALSNDGTGILLGMAWKLDLEY